MDDRKKVQKILQKSLAKVRDALDIDESFLIELVGEDVITDPDRQKIQGITVSNAKVDKLFDIIKKKPIKVYFSFMGVLEEKDGDIHGEIKRIQQELKLGDASAPAPVPAPAPAPAAAQGAAPPKSVQNGYDVMISYQWDAKPRMLKLKEELEKAEISVWMDVSQMRGNILERMAEGVKGAKVILLCFSKKYELSENCQKEAQFANGQKKRIIPLKFEDYKPDNWLGLLIGSLLYYDVRTDESLMTNLPDILKDISGTVGTQSKQTTQQANGSGSASLQQTRPGESDTKVTEKDIAVIVDVLMSDELSIVYIELGLKKRDVLRAEQGSNTPDPKQKATAVFLYWIKMNGKSATRGKVLAALEAKGFQDSYEELKGKLAM